MSVPHGTAGRHGHATPPPLATLAEVVHHGTAEDPSDLVVLCGEGPGSVDLGFWPIPPEVPHPTDVLIGWRAPEWVSALALVTSGEARSEDSIDTVRITVATSVSGHTATVLERAGHPAQTLSEPPRGWGADALRRCLGLPTPAPDHGLHTCVEGNWLVDVAGLVAEAAAGGHRLGWEQVALAHPLHPPGWPARPAQLRAATAALEVESSWERITELMAPGPRRQGLHPPGGELVALDRWFDAGSFARWSVRRLPDLEDLLFEVLEGLPPAVGSGLLDALVSTTSWPPPPGPPSGAEGA